MLGTQVEPLTTATQGMGAIILSGFDGGGGNRAPTITAESDTTGLISGALKYAPRGLYHTMLVISIIAPIGFTNG